MISTRQISGFIHLLLFVLYLSLSPSFAQSLPLPKLPAGVTPGGAKPLIKKFQKKIAPLIPNLEAPDDPPKQEKRIDHDPRMQVSAFTLEGVVDQAKEGIYLKEIESQLEAFRLATPEGFTIGDLRNLAAQLTLTYRQAGFFLARVYIPEQTVSEGVVRIRVIEGHLDQVIVEGNLRYPSSLLMRPFSTQIKKPMHKEKLESALLHLQAYPGLLSSAILSPGQETGATALSLKVEKETPYEGMASTDNYGTELTGQYRVQLALTLNNPGQTADRLSGLVGMGLGGGGNNYFIHLSYDRPVINIDYIAGLGISNNAYKVGDDFEKLDIKGKSMTINTYLLKNFIRRRDNTLTGRIDLSHKKSSSSLSGQSFSDDTLIVLNLSGDFSFRDGLTLRKQSWAGDNHVGLQVIYGDADSRRVGGSGASAEGGFTKVVLNASRLQPIRLKQPFFRNQFVMFKLHYQYTPDLLSSLEQFSMGGPNSVRAYPISENLSDQGLFLSMEWILSATSAATGIFLENLQLSVFVDYARGELTDALVSEESTVTLKGLGAAVQFFPYGKYTARFDLALPIGDPEPSNEATFQLFFRLGYLF